MQKAFRAQDFYAETLTEPSTECSRVKRQDFNILICRKKINYYVANHHVKKYHSTMYLFQSPRRLS